MAIINTTTGAVSHVGLVLSLYETSFDCWYDTNYHAIVWNLANSRPESIHLGSSMGRTATATVDATPEIVELEHTRLQARQAERDAERQAERDATPTRGKQVRVVRGRKVKIGTEGRVFWHGDTGYGPSVGIELLDGSKVFTSARNVEVLALVAV